MSTKLHLAGYLPLTESPRNKRDLNFWCALFTDRVKWDCRRDNWRLLAATSSYQRGDEILITAVTIGNITWIFESGTDLISLLILLLLLLLFLVGGLFKKSLRLSHFKSDWDEIWQYCSASKYASIGFSTWPHTFKLASMTSFHEKSAARHTISLR